MEGKKRDRRSSKEYTEPVSHTSPSCLPPFPPQVVSQGGHRVRYDPSLAAQVVGLLERGFQVVGTGRRGDYLQ